MPPGYERSREAHRASVMWGHRAAPWGRGMLGANLRGLSTGFRKSRVAKVAGRYIHGAQVAAGFQRMQGEGAGSREGRR